jgi:hypothetical protein
MFRLLCQYDLAVLAVWLHNLLIQTGLSLQAQAIFNQSKDDITISKAQLFFHPYKVPRGCR